MDDLEKEIELLIIESYSNYSIRSDRDNVRNLLIHCKICEARGIAYIPIRSGTDFAHIILLLAKHSRTHN